MKRYWDTVFLGLSIFFFGCGIYLVVQHYLPATVVRAETQGISASLAQGLPETISIPSAKVELPIYPSSIKNGHWETTPNGVSYLATTPLPGHLGNTVLYGHNWRKLLGGLVQVKPGDKIELTLDNGQHLSYTVYFVSVVTPDETHIYQNSLDHRLTIYTCTGLLDSHRLVVTAILDEK